MTKVIGFEDKKFLWFSRIYCYYKASTDIAALEFRLSTPKKHSHGLVYTYKVNDITYWKRFSVGGYDPEDDKTTIKGYQCNVGEQSQCGFITAVVGHRNVY
ncbi:MAG: hypothetical protein K0R14_1855 [Burkholderiales bacterium]|nr:hypothetical protein [Burkholderiales bacterium]